jgi:hypothetical protein
MASFFFFFSGMFQFCILYPVLLRDLLRLYSVYGLYFTSIDLILSSYSLIAIEEETKVLIVATIAWGLRKSSRAIMLALILLIAMKPGFIHAVYSMFSQLIIN